MNDSKKIWSMVWIIHQYKGPPVEKEKINTTGFLNISFLHFAFCHLQYFFISFLFCLKNIYNS